MSNGPLQERPRSYQTSTTPPIARLDAELDSDVAPLETNHAVRGERRRVGRAQIKVRAGPTA